MKSILRTPRTVFFVSVVVLLGVIISSYFIYWKSIKTLYHHLQQLTAVSNHLGNGEIFHSSVHSMLMNAEVYIISNGEPKYLDDYLELKKKADARLQMLQRYPAQADTLKSQHSGLSNLKPITERMALNYKIFIDAIDTVMNRNQILYSRPAIIQGSMLFDRIFDDYQKLHNHHRKLRDELNSDTESIWVRSTSLLVGQVIAAIIIGILVVVFLEKVALKIISVTESIALRDQLTGLYNRHALERLLNNSKSHSQGMGSKYGIIMIDLDHFKRFNDTHGHPAGDKLLFDLALTLKNVVRRHDFVIRYGGEEFMVCLPDTDITGTLIVAEKLRQAIESAAFTLPNESPAPRITASFGCGTYPDDGNDYRQVNAAADKRLYDAKRTGRNKVIGP